MEHSNYWPVELKFGIFITCHKLSQRWRRQGHMISFLNCGTATYFWNREI